MKIGILTFHRAHNYGAVLQCYALQEVLKGMGHDVEVIDYRQKWTEEVYKPFSLMVMKVRCKGIRSKIHYIKDFYKRYTAVKKKKASFEAFNSKFLTISKLYCIDEQLNYDVCIVGSDQLWGMGCLGGRFDDVYLGNFKVKEGCKKVGYAISSNLMSIDYLYRHDLLLPSIKNFSSLSFRESAIIDRINEITGKKYPQCIDPTLLTDKSIWSPLLNNKWKDRKYVVSYQARGDGGNGFSLIQTASSFALQRGWDLVDLSTREYDVDDFVSAIANAQYVVTTSFHATVFSLIFHRQFAAYLLHDGHDSRYEDLLRKLDCELFLHEVTEEPKIYKTVDWDKVAVNLSSIRKNSVDYLNKAIHGNLFL